MTEWTREEQKVIDKALANIGKYGTDRVLTSPRGTSVPFKYAVEEFRITVELVFIRNDGWTLGCHRAHQSVAYQMWQDEWIAMIIKPEAEPRHIKDVLAMGDQVVERILGRMDTFPRRLKKPKPGGVGGVWSYVGKEKLEEVREETPE
jgi:hypothetical protein